MNEIEVTNNQLIYWPMFIDLHLLIVIQYDSNYFKLALCFVGFLFEKFDPRYTKLIFFNFNVHKILMDIYIQYLYMYISFIHGKII